MNKGREMGNKKTSLLSVLLVLLQSCAGFTGVPQLGQVQQAQQVGCRCGNSYISCAEICHKDDGADTAEGNDALVIVLGIVAIIGTVVLASAIMPTSPRDKPSDEPNDGAELPQSLAWIAADLAQNAERRAERSVSGDVIQGAQAYDACLADLDRRWYRR